MSTDPEHAAADPSPSAANGVDQAVLVAMKQKLGLPAAGSEAATACPGGATMLVVEADGRVRGCEYATPCSKPAATLAAGTFQDPDLQRLRATLAAGQLPATPCGPCHRRLHQEIPPPAVVDYGSWNAVDPGPTPAVVVLRLPPDGVNLPEALPAALQSWLPGLQHLILELPPSDQVQALQQFVAFGFLAQPGPRLSLRWRGHGPTARWRASLGSVRPSELEWTVERPDPEGLQAALTQAAELGATLTTRFVFGPANWYEFEACARASADAGVPIELRLLDRGGEAPLASLSIPNLTFVKDAIVSTWARFAGTSRPQSMADGAFDRVLAELRFLLREAVEQGLAGTTTGAAVTLRLPRPDHLWFQDAGLRSWWLQQLYGHGHLPAVREWLLRVTQGKGGESAVRRDAWLRTLVQRLACDQQVPELLELLRAVYAEPRGRNKLLQADADFAASFPLQAYGGPWAERLGLLRVAVRKRPFAIGRPRSPRKTTAAPHVTVLIPCYRHEAYIEETLRSVLSQRFDQFKVLVVDDCSPDDTVAAARRVVDPRIQVRVNEQNLGLGNSVLQALETIDTPFVALLNSDDLFHPDRLGRCLDVLVANPAVQLVTTGMALVDSKGGRLTPANASLVLDGKLVYDWVHWFARIYPAGTLPQDEVFAALLERNFLVTSSNLVVRTDWLRSQAPALRSLKFCLDWQLFLEASLANALHHLPDELLAYRLHATNTVWFREGRRWTYYLEVNRVAAEALRRFAERGRERGEAEVARVLEAIAAHLVHNRETDGFALFLNSAFDALQVDQWATSSPRVQDLVQQLNAMAEEVRRARDETENRQGAGDQQRQQLQLLLGGLDREQAGIERDQRRWLQGYADSLELRLKDCWEGRNRLQAEADTLQARCRELEQQLQQAAQREQASAARIEAAERSSLELRGDLQAARGQLAAVQDLRQLIEVDLRQARQERDDQRLLLEAERSEREQMRADLQELAASLLRGQVELLEQHRLAKELREARDTLAAELSAELGTVRGEVTELRTVRDELQRERGELRREHESLRGQHEDLQHEMQQLHREHQQLQQARADLHREHELLQQARQDQLHQQAAIEAQRAEERRNHELLRSAHADLESQHEEACDAIANLQAAQSELASEREALFAANAAMRTDLAERRSELDRAVAAAQRLEESLAAETAQVTTLAAAKKDTERRLHDVRAENDRLRGEIETLRASREFRAGNFLWNKMPLGYMSRRGKKWYRRLVDAKDRCLMWGSGLLRRRARSEGTAVVAACWQWPIYSHTFVYQEMIGLSHLGLSVQLFHWEVGNLGELHQAFGYLAEHRTQLQPVWENHLRDKEHFEKTAPGRLRAFLERVAAATGKPVEQLEKEPLVLQGCTFARMAQLAGANYLHSYFFYDQSFMVMQAAWLLGLPRGVSCYADHMLQDYDYKLVPLQVELSDVIVATSARIKRELLEMTGGKHAEKIIVKPNGVDGARFPPVQRKDRQPGDAFEVISISRIEPKKGLIHLAEAVAALKQRGHRVKAHIVGSKDPHSRGSLEYAAEFEQRIRELGLQDDIILHGMKKQEALAPILQRCRAFVAPYVELGSGDKDGIPTAMLEGLASGLPVVTTDSGSILEVVTHEAEGLVVAQRDSAAFAAALGRLIEDPELERRMARAARARFDREFDIRVTEQRLHARVAALIAANRQTATR